jgi:hypothetical protein
MMMKEKSKLPLPILALFGFTRGMIGAGVGMLLAERFARGHRRMIAFALIGAGALSTLPIGVTMFRARRTMNGKRVEPEAPMTPAYANR